MGFTWDFVSKNNKAFTEKLYTYGLRFAEKECLDLPPQTYLDVNAYLPDKASKLYWEIYNERIAQLKDKVLLYDNPLTAMMKCRQVCNGFLLEKDPTDDTKNITTELHEAKLNVLEELLEQIGDQQVIIWAVFHHDIEKIVERLNKKSVQAQALYGKTSNQDKVISSFKEGITKYLVAHPKKAGHGLTFVNAKYNIWYSMDFSSENYYQANKRTHRIGQESHVFYYHILATDNCGNLLVDQAIKDAVASKLSSSKEILDLIIDIHNEKNF